MKHLLEELWNSYLTQKPTEQTEEKRELIGAILEVEDKLREKLDEKQIDLLEQYVDCIGNLHAVSETEAFIGGVRFASSFLVEALGKD